MSLLEKNHNTYHSLEDFASTHTSKNAELKKHTQPQFHFIWMPGFAPLTCLFKCILYMWSFFNFRKKRKKKNHQPRQSNSSLIPFCGNLLTTAHLRESIRTLTQATKLSVNQETKNQCVGISSGSAPDQERKKNPGILCST